MRTVVRTSYSIAQWLTGLFAMVAAALSSPASLHAQTAPGMPACTAPAEFTRLGHTLTHMALRLASGEPITIVAFGSSSTAGAGASSPAATYPSRLEADLKTRFPGRTMKVLNRGVGGEDASEMLARMDRDVAPERPDLVLWQVGTNAVLSNHALAGEAPLIREGIRRMKALGADIVLIDPQYAPKLLDKGHDVDGMVRLIGAEAKAGNIGLFQRSALMRHWRESQGIGFEMLLSPDGLHMNDWSYGCVARQLGIAIADAVRSPAMAGARARDGKSNRLNYM
jgi:acyl-CoA thioesterase-1